MGKRGRRTTVLRALALLAALSFYPFPFSTPASFFRSHAANPDSAAVSNATREGRLAVFDDAWSTINDRYYDRTFHGLDWDAQRLVFRSRAAETNSSEELYDVMRSMIAGLDDPHTRVFTPEEKFDWWHPRFVSIGVAIREVSGLPTVVKVERGSAPQRAGIRAGDVIESLNGVPVLSLINEKLAGASPANASSRYRAFAKTMDGPPETAVEVRWKSKKDNESSANFRRHLQQRELGIRVRRVKGGYALLEIDAFTNPIALSFASGLKEKLEDARGIIIDLRSNGGGDAQAMADIASAFVGEGFSLGQFTDRSGSSFTITTRSKSMLTPDRIARTSLPLIVLTSAGTSSAAEIFVAALQSYKRATIIGTETCGCVLAIRTRHELPDGGLLDVSELDYQTAAGERLEGHGLKPDETVVVERSDLYSGRDRAMELAINKLALLHSAHH